MNRRGLVSGLGALFICAPAIVRVSSLMPLSFQPRLDHMILPTGSWEGMFEVEVDEHDPNRVNVFVKQEYVDQLRIMANIVEMNMELAL